MKKILNIRLRDVFIFICIIIILIMMLYINILKKYPQIKEVIVEKEVVVEIEKEVEVETISEVYIEVKPKNYYDITSEEREMLARLLYREAGTTSMECQKMIISVIFNRYDTTKDASLSDIVYADGQFTPVSILYKTTPTEQNYEVVDYIIKNGSILPSYVKFFRAGHHFDWDGYIGYTSIDNVYFGYLAKDKSN